MIKNRKALIALTAAFLVAESALGVLLQTSQDEIPINLRYTAVVLACLFCVLFAEKSLSYLFTQIALVCAVGADFFLVFLPEMKQLRGMLFFSVTQIAYFLRLYFEDENRIRKKVHLITRISLSAAVMLITACVLGRNTDALALLSMFYYANLAMNIIFALADFKKNSVFPIGLILFILCDTVIGFSFIDMYIPLSEGSLIYKIIHPGFDLAWAFYLPSQALLAISLLPPRLKKSHKTK